MSSKPPASSSTTKPASSEPSASIGPPPQPTPYISANAWMSFFLFCCLVLIILQGPLGLSGGIPVQPVGMAGAVAASGGGGPCYTPPPCSATPLIAPAHIAPEEPGMMMEEQYHPRQQPQMGGQGHISTPGGGAGWSWYSNDPQSPRGYYRRSHRGPPPRCRGVQYQRPGLQLQVQSGRASSQPQDGYQPQSQALSSPIPPATPPPADAAVAVPAPVTTATSLQNLENAFYPLLVGAIALLLIFDYAS